MWGSVPRNRSEVRTGRSVQGRTGGCSSRTTRVRDVTAPGPIAEPAGVTLAQQSVEVCRWAVRVCVAGGVLVTTARRVWGHTPVAGWDHELLPSSRSGPSEAGVFSLHTERLPRGLGACLSLNAPFPRSVRQVPTITKQSKVLVAFPFDEYFQIECEAKGNPEPQ